LSSEPRDTDGLSGRKPGRRGAISGSRGSASVEAAVVVPIFLIALFSLAYAIKVFMAYSIMQSALQNVARSISNASYFYHLSGLKDYQDELDRMGQNASGELKNQAETVIGAVDSFGSLISNITSSNPSVDLETRIENAIALGKDLSDKAKDVVGLVKGIIQDPRQEIRLLLTVFAQKAAYAARKEMVCLISRLMLDAELEKRSATGMDVKKALGIGDISFSQSQVFGDGESLEFIITYTVNPPAPFGLVPKLKLSNRVKVIGWTSGRGSSARREEEQEKTGDSIWTRMDTEKKYWDRGLDIEDKEVEKLKGEAESMNMEFKATSRTYPVVDAFIYDDHTVRMYDLFTLNPFMKTYQDQPGRVKSEIKKHGKRLLEFEPPDSPEAWNAPNKERIVIIILPENAKEALTNIEQLISEAEAELLRLGITEVRVRYDYGVYTRPEEGSADEEDGGTREGGDAAKDAA